MKRRVLIFFIVFILPISTFAAFDPIQKECLQRGYQTDGRICTFPNGTSCPLETFNDKSCGLEFRIEAYCVKEGGYVWDENRCCPDLKPYLRKDVLHQTCESSTKMFFKNPMVMIGGGVIFLGMVACLFLVFWKKRNNIQEK